MSMLRPNQPAEPTSCQNQSGIAKTDLEVIFEGTHDAVTIVNVDKNGRFTYHAANQRYLEAVGHRQETLLGKTPVDIHGEIAGKHIQRYLKRCLELKTSIQYEETIELGGFQRMALVQLSPIFRKGEIKQILGSTRDITDQKKIEHQLDEQNKNLEALFTNSSDGIAFFDKNHRILDINQRFSEIFGYTIEEIKGKNLDDVISVREVREQAGDLTRQLMDGKPVSLEAVRYHKSGNPIRVAVKGIAVQVDGRITGGYGIYTDITREKVAQEALRISEERWQFALEGSGNGVWDWDIETDRVFYSEQYLRILGYNSGQLPETFETFLTLVYPEDRQILHLAHQRHMKGDAEVVATEYRIQCRDGQWKWVLSKGKVMRRDEQGQPLRMVGTITDITERKLSEEKIRYLSYHDKLTGLYNRAFFEEELHRLDCPRNWPLAIMISDVDGLKIANDLYGHLVGDQLLQQIAAILSKSCRKDDIIARWGGDEFALLLPSTSERDAMEVGYRISRFCKESMDLPIQPSISWGIAVKESPEQSLDSLIRKAELSMYKQKVKSEHSTQHQLRKRYKLADMFIPTGERGSFDDS